MSGVLAVNYKVNYFLVFREHYFIVLFEDFIKRLGEVQKQCINSTSVIYSGGEDMNCFDKVSYSRKTSPYTMMSEWQNRMFIKKISDMSPGYFSTHIIATIRLTTHTAAHCLSHMTRQSTRSCACCGIMLFIQASKFNRHPTHLHSPRIKWSPCLYELHTMPFRICFWFRLRYL